jgi:hypothetical protein
MSITTETPLQEYKRAYDYAATERRQSPEASRKFADFFMLRYGGACNPMHTVWRIWTAP